MRSEVGLALARILHRPFLDASDPAGGDEADGDSADVVRLDRLMAVSTAAVIAAPLVALEPPADDANRPRSAVDRWLLVVDDPADPGSSDDLRGHADAVLSSSLPIDESEIVRLVAEFRDATQRTSG